MRAPALAHRGREATQLSGSLWSAGANRCPDAHRETASATLGRAIKAIDEGALHLGRRRVLQGRALKRTVGLGKGRRALDAL